MYTGTMIEELIATVERAEERGPRKPVFIEPKVINGGITWGFLYEPARIEPVYAGVA